MIEITLNGEPNTLPQPLTIQELIERIGLDPRKVAVEVNREVVPKARHPDHRLQGGDAVEIVTLVGGGAPSFLDSLPEGKRVLVDKPLKVGKFTFQSRLITGT